MRDMQRTDIHVSLFLSNKICHSGSVRLYIESEYLSILEEVAEKDVKARDTKKGREGTTLMHILALRTVPASEKRVTALY